jgi:hypothetical protein
VVISRFSDYPTNEADRYDIIVIFFKVALHTMALIVINRLVNISSITDIKNVNNGSVSRMYRYLREIICKQKNIELVPVKLQLSKQKPLRNR